MPSPEYVVESVRKDGFLIWHGFIKSAFAAHVVDHSRKLINDHSSYVSLRYGVQDFIKVVPPHEYSELLPGKLGSIFRAAIPEYEVPIKEIYLTVPGYFQPHEWHQDANETNIEYHFMVWIACTPCGEKSPGLSFAMGNPGEFIGGNKAAERYSQVHRRVHPILEPGDAIFFDTHSVHKTNVNKDMKLSRVAYKIGVRNANRMADSKE